MMTQRQIGHAPRTQALGKQVSSVQGPCIGCKGCTGLCAALIEVLSLPETVLNRT